MSAQKSALADAQKPVEVYAKYTLSSVDPETLTMFQSMEGVSTSIDNGSLTVKMVLPNSDDESNPDDNDTELLDTTSVENTSDYDEVNFMDMVEAMDNNNGIQDIPDGTQVNEDGTVNTLVASLSSSKSYPGQKYSGQKVKTGTHVHCNRFNGTHSDYKYWSKTIPKAFIDFFHSDCDYHAIQYGCSSIGSMSKCDGANWNHKGVKDCSSWFSWWFKSQKSN